MDGGHRAFVAGVHRLDHASSVSALAALADDDPVGPHTQRVLDEVGRRDGAASFDVGRASLQANDVILLKLQLGRVLDRDDAVVVLDEAGEGVEQRRLTRAGAPRDDHVEPGPHRPFHEREHLGREGFEAEQVFLGQRPRAEHPDGHRGAIERERRDDGVETRAIGQSRVDHR